MRYGDKKNTYADMPMTEAGPGMPSEPQEAGEVRRMIVLLDKQVGIMFEIAQNVEAALAPIMADVPPDQAENDAKIYNPMAPLAEELRNIIDRVENTTAIMVSILKREQL